MATITTGEGFWVHSDTEQTLTYTGTPLVDTSHTLGSGWSLIGLKSKKTKPIADLIAGKEASIASIWKWKDNTWAVYLPGGGTETYAASKGFTALEEMESGEGFWVNCTGEVTLP